jgi:Fe-S-cluster containining protein
MECSKCIASCCHYFKVVAIKAEDIVHIAAFLQVSQERVKEEFLAQDEEGNLLTLQDEHGNSYHDVRKRQDETCIFLKPDEKCAVYPVRPQTCIDFPMGGVMCLTLYVNRNTRIPLVWGMGSDNYRKLLNWRTREVRREQWQTK